MEVMKMVKNNVIMASMDNGRGWIKIGDVWELPAILTDDTL